MITKTCEQVNERPSFLTEMVWSNFLVSHKVGAKTFCDF